MTLATITGLSFATASAAPIWIAGWIIVLAIIIGAAIIYTRRRKRGNQQVR